MEKEINDLHDLLMDPLFPELDMKLRTGWHCDEEEIDSFEFISRFQDKIEMFYELYGYELLYATEGYYFLHPVSGNIKTYQLGIESMIISQFLALMKLDPQYLEASGSFNLEELVDRMELMLGKQQVVSTFLKRKRKKESISEQDYLNVQQAVKRSLRELSRYGFVTVNSDFSQIYPRKPIFRFMDPVRNLDNPKTAMESLIKGESPVETDEDMEESDE